MSNRPQRGKNKGRTALYFPKWHYTTPHTDKRNQRNAIANGRGIFK
ncbi:MULTISPECIES: hypothetical protein [unclassified Moraxella]